MHLKFVWSGPNAIAERPENRGLDRAIAGLRAAARCGDTLSVVNASRLLYTERASLYREALRAARTRYRVAPVFGENKPGEAFGRAVPALIVYMSELDTRGAEVFPHQSKDGSICTIEEGLASFGIPDQAARDAVASASVPE